jgi:hypothetical protein
MPLVEEYKRNAVECFRLAAELTDPEQRLVMLDMAYAWSRLADQAHKNRQYPEAPQEHPD